MTGRLVRMPPNAEPVHGVPEPLPPVLTTRGLARLLQASESQVRRMNLPGFEVGRGRWRYVTRQVLEELERRAQRGGLSVRRTQ